MSSNATHHHCFLCRFNTHRDSVEMHQFIQEHVGAMHVDSLSREVHAELVNRKEQMTDACNDDISFEVVREHITSHTLMPAVRVAGILRSLPDLNDKLATILSSEDDDGNVVIDSKNVNSFIKVTDEIMQMYKSGNVNRLLFSDPTTMEKGGAAGGGERPDG